MQASAPLVSLRSTGSLPPAADYRRWLAWLAWLLLLAALGPLSGCAGLPPGANFPKTESIALEHPEETPLGKQFAASAQAHGGQSAFRLVPVGLDGFLLRAQMIEQARKSLDMQYFIFQADETGKLLIDAILRAADRGVRVRLLVDDVDNAGVDAQVEALDAHPNIEVRLYNPLRYRGSLKALRWAELLFNAPRLDYRMHNKLLVVDNAIALVGGRNIGDEYFQVDPEGQEGDFETFAGGPVVPRLSASFDEFWASVPAIPVEALFGGAPTQETLASFREALRQHRQEKKEDGSDYASRVGTGEPLGGVLGGRIPLVWAHAEVQYDSPDKRQVENGRKPGRLLRHAILQTVGQTQAELLMISAYFIPGDDGMKILADLRQRNVDVRVLTNSLEANPEASAQSGYQHYRLPLLRDDVALYEIRAMPGSARGTGQTAAMSRHGNFGLHTKLYVFDRQKIFVSSMNFDQRSLHINTELGLLIDSPELARQGAAVFEGLTQPLNSYRVRLESDKDSATPRLSWHTMQDGQPISYAEEPAKSAWQRLKVRMLTLLPFDHEL